MRGQRRVIHIVGAAGSGKTTLRLALARELGIPSFSIDDERRAQLRPGESWPRHDDRCWAELRRQFERLPAAIVETSGSQPAGDLALFFDRTEFKIETVVDDAVRRVRLAERAASSDPLVGRDRATFVERLMRVGRVDYAVDLVVDASRPLEDLTPIVVAAAEAFLRPRAAA